MLQLTCLDLYFNVSVSIIRVQDITYIDLLNVGHRAFLNILAIGPTLHSNYVGCKKMKE